MWISESTADKRIVNVKPSNGYGISKSEELQKDSHMADTE